MKKKLIYGIVIVMVFALVGCAKKDKDQEEKKDTSDFNSKIAINIINNYMIALMNDDMENAKKFYSKELKDKNMEVMSSELKIEGFKLDDISEVSNSVLIRVRVTRSVREKPSASLDTYSVKIIKEEDEYKIKEINSMNEKEAFQEEDGLRMRSKNNIRTFLILDLDGIPENAFPKNDKVNISKIKVPKTNYGNINYSYSGDKLSLVTYDKHSFIGIAKIDESLAVQGGGSQGGGQGGGQGEGQGGKPMPKGSKSTEMPIGKELTSLDLLRDAKVLYTSFSLDEKFLMVQYSKANVGSALRIYNVDSGELIPASIEDEFPPEKFDVVFYSYDTDVINFDVKEKKGMSKEEIQRIGRYQINLKDFKMKKL